MTSHTTGYSFSPDKLVVGYCATGNVKEGLKIGLTIITNILSASSGCLGLAAVNVDFSVSKSLLISPRLTKLTSFPV